MAVLRRRGRRALGSYCGAETSFSAPSPGFRRSAALRSESDLSPQAGRGEGEASSRHHLALLRAGRSDKETTGGSSMRGFAFLLLLAGLVAATGAAADYPARPIRLVVPQAPGSATDTVARILGGELAKEIGQQIIVDNRPGGALTIGLDLTAKAEPDGYTICIGP